jgi:hypothetical protein
MRYRSVHRVVTAQMRRSDDTVTLVVAVEDDDLVGATDDMFDGRRPSSWSHLQGPFKLYLLREVPLSIAERIIDHPRPGGAGLRSDKMAWRVAQPFADDRPFYEG